MDSSQKGHSNEEIVPVKGLVNGMKVKDGVNLPTFMNDISGLRTMKVRPDDTFVIGYPKSGTTWVESIVWLIRNGSKAEASEPMSDKAWLKSIFLDFGISDSELEALKSPRIFKSHLFPQFLPEHIESKGKVIYVIRNPKDLIVSVYHFSQNVVNDEFTGTFEELFDLMIEGKYWYGYLWDHINTFTSIPNVHVVHYESLLENTREEITRMASFIGKELDEQELDEIVRLSSFNEMKKSEKDILHKDIEANTFKKELKFFRNGKSGEWRHMLTKEMSDKVEQLFKQNLKYQGNMHFDS